MRNVLGPIVLATLAGCVSTSQVMETGRDAFTVTATADGMRDAAAARGSAFEAGAQKCREMRKRFVLTDESLARTRMGIDTTITVNFRCLSETDPEYLKAGGAGPAKVGG